jgi:hypothetical protein
MQLHAIWLALLVSVFSACAAQIAIFILKVNLDARNQPSLYAPVCVQHSLETDGRAPFNRS